MHHIFVINKCFETEYQRRMSSIISNRYNVSSLVSNSYTIINRSTKRFTGNFTFSVFGNVMWCIHFNNWFYSWFCVDIVSLICEKDTFKPEWRQLFEREWSRREVRLMEHVLERYFTDKKAGRKCFHWLHALNFITLPLTLNKAHFFQEILKKLWKRLFCFLLQPILR